VQLNKLLDANQAELTEALHAGFAVDPSALDDTEYRGISLGIPGVIEKLTWKTFKKVFHRDPERGVLRGWNVRMKQQGIDGPWVPMTKRGQPLTFGHFEVVPAGAEPVPQGCERGLLIHYGRGHNRRLDPVGRLRDPIVALEEGSAERLLGWSYLDIAGRHVKTPSFFYLERDMPLSHTAYPPR
jgi:hypothetical protein